MVTDKSLEIHLHINNSTRRFNTSNRDEIEEFLNLIVDVIDRRDLFSVSTTRKVIESSWDVNDD